MEREVIKFGNGKTDPNSPYGDWTTPNAPPTQAHPPIILTEEAWAFLAAEVARRQGRDQAAHDARRLEDKRDAFAAAALTGLLAYSNRPPGYGNAADVAWEVADAMMGARERVPTRETRK